MYYKFSFLINNNTLYFILFLLAELFNSKVFVEDFLNGEGPALQAELQRLDEESKSVEGTYGTSFVSCFFYF